jgi:plasmid stabilization system protein ParE
MGRAGRAPRTRELVMRGLPYVVVYEIDDGSDAVIVLAVFHAAQNRPSSYDSQG